MSEIRTHIAAVQHALRVAREAGDYAPPRETPAPVKFACEDCWRVNVGEFEAKVSRRTHGGCYCQACRVQRDGGPVPETELDEEGDEG